jgi:uncharacterized protein YbcI
VKRSRLNLVQGLENLLSKAESELSEKKKQKLKARVENNARTMRNRELKKQEQKLIKKTMLDQALPILPKKNRKLKAGSTKIISSAFETNRRKH